MAQINKPSDYFNTILYTGNGGTASRTGVGFEPSLVWVKSRSNTDNHNWIDQVRGGDRVIVSNSTDNQEPSTNNKITSFDSDGFSTGDHTPINRNGGTHAAWCWKANGTGAANSNGSISATVSAETTSGFSIVKYNGTGSAATVGHGLGVAPKFIIVKNLSDDGTNWFCYHSGIASDAETDYILLNATAAKVDGTYWNDTAPTSSVFSIGTQNDVNGSGDQIIAYCFAEKKGFSKFGSYTGNGNADGTFIYTGFKPALITTKQSASTGAWLIYDSKRNPFNLTDKKLLPNENGAENASTSPSGVTASTNNIDIVSNGFKQRTTQGYNNANGETYIYMAFAEEPIVGSNNIPATAR